MKQLSILIFFLVQAFYAESQNSSCPPIPDRYGWQTADDYAHERENIEKVLRWLCHSPLGADIEQRSLANAYVMEWLAGTPEVTVDVNTALIPFLDENPELLFTVIHGMALYQLGRPHEKDAIKSHAKGLDTLAELCEQSVELSREHELKALLKAHRKKKMKEYVNERLLENQ